MPPTFISSTALLVIASTESSVWTTSAAGCECRSEKAQRRRCEDDEVVLAMTHCDSQTDVPCTTLVKLRGGAGSTGPRVYGSTGSTRSRPLVAFLRPSRTMRWLNDPTADGRLFATTPSATAAIFVELQAGLVCAAKYTPV